MALFACFSSCNKTKSPLKKASYCPRLARASVPLLLLSPALAPAHLQRVALSGVGCTPRGLLHRRCRATPLGSSPSCPCTLAARRGAKGGMTRYDGEIRPSKLTKNAQNRQNAQGSTLSQKQLGGRKRHFSKSVTPNPKSVKTEKMFDAKLCVPARTMLRIQELR